MELGGGRLGGSRPGVVIEDRGLDTTEAGAGCEFIYPLDVEGKTTLMDDRFSSLLPLLLSSLLGLDINPLLLATVSRKCSSSGWCVNRPALVFIVCAQSE